MKSIFVKITANEGYDDVHPDLMLEDAQTTPQGFGWEIAPQAAEGWKRVPVEPTDEMLDALTGFNFTSPFNPKAKAMRQGAYRALLNAAPTKEQEK